MYLNLRIFQKSVKKMLRIFTIFISFWFSFAFSAELDKDSAFNFSAKSVGGGFELDINFDKSVYLYANKLKVSVENNDISALLELPKPANNELNESFNIFIPMGILKGFDDKKSNVIVAFQGCSYTGFCYAPMRSEFRLSLLPPKVLETKLNIVNAQNQPSKTSLSSDEQIANELSKSSFFWILASFFGYGILLSLTPCVLPMVPVLSGIIVAKASRGASRGAKLLSSLEYVLAMSVANAVLGVLAATLGAGLAAYLQQPIFIIFGAIIFVLLAVLIFSSHSAIFVRFNNFLNAKAGAFSGHFGVIFMGAISALILSPCVAAPLAGALLYIAGSGDILLGGFALFALGLGMGAPLLAIGAGFASMPRPGAWMMKITQIFGFVMLGVAIWLLSRIIGDFAWILYGLLGVFAGVFLADFKAPANAIARAFLALNLSFIGAGLACFMIFALSFGVGNSRFSSNAAVTELKADLSIDDLSKLQEKIKTASKPVIVDFWASWCVNCIEFEKELSKDEMAQKLLSNFEIIKVDLSNMSENKQGILEFYSIFGPPAFLIFESGELRKKIIATPKMDEFKEILKEFS